MSIAQLEKTLPSDKDLEMDYEAYLEWTDEDIRSEWVDGKAIIEMPPKHSHQTMVEFLYWLMNTFVTLFQLGLVRIAPFEVKLSPFGSSREPDIFFLSNANKNLLTEERLRGAPDLAVEIISQESVKRDRDDKFREYASAGIKEYWIIDSRKSKRRADFYRLNERSVYELFATEDDERIESRVLAGFWLKPVWLWQAETLDPLHVFCEMRGLSDENAALIRQLLTDGN